MAHNSKIAESPRIAEFTEINSYNFITLQIMAKRISDAANQAAKVTTNPREFASSQNQWDRSQGYTPTAKPEEVSIPKKLLKDAHDELCKAQADFFSSDTHEIILALEQYLNK